MTLRSLRRGTAAGGAALLAVATLLAGCGGGDSDDGAATTEGTEATEGTGTTGADDGHQGPAAPSPTGGGDQTTTETTPAAGTLIEVEVSDGSVQGGAERVEVPLGDEVTVRVTADVSDEVHVHGYDLFADVTPDSPGEITFTADIPGIFEIELEGAGRQLRELEVA